MPYAIEDLNLISILGVNALITPQINGKDTVRALESFTIPSDTPCPDSPTIAPAVKCRAKLLIEIILKFIKFSNSLDLL